MLRAVVHPDFQIFRFESWTCVFRIYVRMLNLKSETNVPKMVPDQDFRLVNNTDFFRELLTTQPKVITAYWTDSWDKFA